MFIKIVRLKSKLANRLFKATFSTDLTVYPYCLLCGSPRGIVALIIATGARPTVVVKTI
jgi:hypothetical protein